MKTIEVWQGSLTQRESAVRGLETLLRHAGRCPPLGRGRSRLEPAGVVGKMPPAGAPARGVFPLRLLS